MQLIKAREALTLADADGFVLFGGKNDRQHPMQTPIKAMPVLQPRGVVDWQDEDGNVFLRNWTGTTVWAAPTTDPTGPAAESHEVIGARYPEADWREAYRAAEEKDFDVTDSREQSGELAGVVAELREDEAENDEGLLWAAITVASNLVEGFDRDFLSHVITSRDEEAEQGLANRARGYVIARWPDFPIQEISDLDRFAARYALHEHERVAEDELQFLFVFNLADLTAAG
ncbi:hypothetical protein [Streptomyces phytophilus]|uniref:hypothetical protein n=1 Tax=Streptomyces phytophilus TaxID=722715 RepID=UPI0015F0DD40|nr:hypothetical protein [Streptomyces phytophilus]